MRKGLKIIDGLYLNMANIVTFEVASEELIVGLNAAAVYIPDFLHISFNEEEPLGKEDLGFEVTGIVYVEINHLHRIKREISNYLGVDELALIKNKSVIE
ncbi:hypothetical protein MT390_17290 [Vibrio sp. 2-Bac 85]